MIRAPKAGAEQVCTTSRAHVEAVAKRHKVKATPTDDYLYAMVKVPALGQPIIYRARVTP